MVQKLKKKLKQLQNRETHIDQLKKKLTSIKKGFNCRSKQLTDIRKNWAEQLTTKIHQELKELYMEKTIFEVIFIKQWIPAILFPIIALVQLDLM